MIFVFSRLCKSAVGGLERIALVQVNVMGTRRQSSIHCIIFHLLCQLFVVEFVLFS